VPFVSRFSFKSAEMIEGEPIEMEMAESRPGIYASDRLPMRVLRRVVVPGSTPMEQMCETGRAARRARLMKPLCASLHP
jgi:hypothetical protein